MDQFVTTYQNDYLRREIRCPMGAHHMRIDPTAEPGKVDCRPKAYVGEATGGPAAENPLMTCPCRSGGTMPQRGAVANGLPNNLDKSCACFGGGPQHRPPTLNKEELAEMMYKAAETGNIKAGCTSCKNKPDLNPLTQPGQAPRIPQQVAEAVPCQRQEKFRPVPVGQFGGQYEGPLNREHAEQGPRPNEQAMPFAFDKPCMCAPGKPESGPQNYGPAWIRERAAEQPIERRLAGGSVPVPPEVAKLVNPEAPAARVSCAPEADVAKFDQPNTFMRKLYDKYPYLYQILRDTPPEELIARVFKDRFLSTYQVDYLHMGSGKEHFSRGGEQMDEKFVSPEGEDEPNMIPGCTYRSTKRGNFGRKKSTLKMKEREEEEEEPEVVKEEPRISEYMASISKLGGEIITEKLYVIEANNRKALAGKTYT